MQSAAEGEPQPLRVAVVVLGDLGRSPRMQYHALALAERGAEVDLVGLAGAPPIDEVSRHPRIRCHRLTDPTPPAAVASAARWRLLAAGGRRSLRQAFVLWNLLARGLLPFDVLLVQTPPALPTLPIAWLAARRRAARLIFDWHNFAGDMLALKLGRAHWAVALTNRIERLFAVTATAHLCVSRAMATTLEQRAGIAATVLHDRPGPEFQPLDPQARQTTLRRLLTLSPDSPIAPVVVSSTSWSVDEDFDVLLDAASHLEREVEQSQPGTVLRIVITGNGPLRASFERRLATLGLRRVDIRTMWLSWDEYRRLLAAADVGLCLHRSASGVDLPMKLQDMFGAGLPVCVLNYGPCLAEVVEDGENGWLFCQATDLARLLARLSLRPEEVQRAREAVGTRRGEGWIESWNRTVAPVVMASPRGGGRA